MSTNLQLVIQVIVLEVLFTVVQIAMQIIITLRQILKMEVVFFMVVPMKMLITIIRKQIQIMNLVYMKVVLT